jgi:hypothetical protein
MHVKGPQPASQRPSPDVELRHQPLQAAEAAAGASTGPLTAWDVPDSLRLGHEPVVAVGPLRRAADDASLCAQLTLARDGSIRIQVNVPLRLLFRARLLSSVDCALYWALRVSGGALAVKSA